MNWKAKGLTQSALSLVPGSGTLNYWAQRWVTRAYADFGSIIQDKVDKARWFADQFAHYGATPIGEAQFYEFGAGWHLAGPLALYCLGVNRQIVVDLTRCVRLELVNQAIDGLSRYSGNLVRRPGPPLKDFDELASRFGIEYRAPADARGTGLPPASIDCVTSTYTFEHIPRADVQGVMKECGRLLKRGGVMLSMIDYQDHYSYRDRGISVYNFLQYTEKQWRWFNSSLHYQSRMRHCEYRGMFIEAGLGVLGEELMQPKGRDLQGLAAIRLAPDFYRFPVEELMVLGSRMVCCAGAATPRSRQAATAQAGWESIANR
jgi:SAM-dependent methyltransferase